MKKIILLIISLVLINQTIAQTVILDGNNVTVKWTGTSVPSPYFVQANPRGTGMEWFAIVNQSTCGRIGNYANNSSFDINFFTPPGNTSPIPFNNIVTTLATNMQGLFASASSFNQPISDWDVSNVTNMNGMFKFSPFNQPIGNWNVSNVIDMQYMFWANSAFNQPIGNWNVSNVIDMQYMFKSASSFNQPIGNWNVSNVTNMQSMFSVATSFNQPIGNWNVSNVTNMTQMFYNSGLSTSNYDALLIGWSTISPNEVPLKPNVVFSGGNSKYCNGASARNILDFSPNNWTITDGGQDPNCVLGTEEFDTNNIKLYPNPVINILNIKSDYNLINQPYTIIDGLGRVVLNGKLNEVDSTINVEELSKGIYYLKVSDKNANKFIKE
jgi:surface protein